MKCAGCGKLVEVRLYPDKLIVVEPAPVSALERRLQRFTGVGFRSIREHKCPESKGRARSKVCPKESESMRVRRETLLARKGNTLCPGCRRASLPTATLPRICPLCGALVSQGSNEGG